MCPEENESKAGRFALRPGGGAGTGPGGRSGGGSRWEAQAGTRRFSLPDPV